MRRLIFKGMPPHVEMLKEKKITELIKNGKKNKAVNTNKEKKHRG